MPARKRYLLGEPGRIYIAKRRGRWWWYCNICYPATLGSTASYEKTVKNVEKHCEHLKQHHEYMRRHRA